MAEGMKRDKPDPKILKTLFRKVHKSPTAENISAAARAMADEALWELEIELKKTRAA
jgi:hypothetical protein